MKSEETQFSGTEDERQNARDSLALLKHFVELNASDRRRVIEFAASLNRAKA